MPFIVYDGGRRTPKRHLTVRTAAFRSVVLATRRLSSMSLAAATATALLFVTNPNTLVSSRINKQLQPRPVSLVTRNSLFVTVRSRSSQTRTPSVYSRTLQFLFFKTSTSITGPRPDSRRSTVNNFRRGASNEARRQTGDDDHYIVTQPPLPSNLHHYRRDVRSGRREQRTLSSGKVYRVRNSEQTRAFALPPTICFCRQTARARAPLLRYYTNGTRENANNPLSPARPFGSSVSPPIKTVSLAPSHPPSPPTTVRDSAAIIVGGVRKPVPWLA